MRTRINKPKPDMVDELSIAEMRMRVRIDRNNLDEEVANHPTLCMDARERAAYARSRATQAKDELAVVEARLYPLLVRKASERAEKTSDPAIKAAVLTHSKRTAAFHSWLALDAKAKEWEGVVDTFHERGYMLRECVQLIVVGYSETRSVKGPATTHHASSEYDKERKAMADQRRKRREE